MHDPTLRFTYFRFYVNCVCFIIKIATIMWSWYLPWIESYICTCIETIICICINVNMWFIEFYMHIIIFELKIFAIGEIRVLVEPVPVHHARPQATRPAACDGPTQTENPGRKPWTETVRLKHLVPTYGLKPRSLPSSLPTQHDRQSCKLDTTHRFQ